MSHPDLFPDLPKKQKQEFSALIFEAKQQGQEANIAGKLCERAIEDAFRLRGIPVLRYDPRAASDLFEKRILLRNAPYMSIYGARSKSEFLYVHDTIRVRIECRAQMVPGSVDEKFPYLLRNAERTMPEKNVWLIIEGIGAREKSIKWIKEEAFRIKTKNVRVMNLAEAQRAVKQLVEQGKA